MFIKNLKNINWFVYYIYFYIFVTPWHFSKSQTSILSAILLIWAIIKYKKEILVSLKKYIKFTPIFLLFLFIIYSYISSLWSEPIKDGFNHVNTFTKYYFLFIPAILISMNKELAINAIKILTISFGGYAIYSILIYLGVLHVEGAYTYDPKGHLRNLVVSQYMAIGFFISIFISFFSENRKEKGCFLLISILTFFALFINNSRTAQVSFLIVLVIFFMIFFRKYFLNLKYLLIFFIMICYSSYIFYENNKLNRFQLAYKEFTDAVISNKLTGSLGVRLYFNKTGIEILKDNLLFGTGPSDNRMLLQKKQKEDPNYLGDTGKGRVINHFHSEHMDKLTAYGLVGYSVLFMSIVLLIYSLRKEGLYYYISLSVFLTLFFNSFANKTLSVKPLTYIYILFFIFLAIIAYNKNVDKNLEEKV